MNHIYRIVFNRSAGMYQAVCEIARASCGGKASITRGDTTTGPAAARLPRTRLTALACLLAGTAPVALAANCPAGDEAALAACIASATGTDTITLQNDIALVGVLAGMAPGVTIVSGGHSLTGTGALDLGNGTYWSTANSTLLDATGQTQFNGTTGTLAAATGTALTVNGTLFANSGSVVNLGTATDTGTINLALSSTSTNGTASISVNGGTVIDSGALGLSTSIAANTTIMSGATLQLNGGANVKNLQGGGTLKAASAVTVQSGNFSGGIEGGGAITKSGAGTLVLSGTGLNTYTGATQVTGGILQAGAANVFSSASALAISNGGTVALNSFNQSIGALSGAAGGNVSLGTATLTTNVAAGTSTYDGVITGTGTLGAVVKTGAGTLVLSGANTYMGGTTINGGTVKIGAAGAMAAGSGVAVATGATLDLNNFNQTLSSLTGPGNVALGSGTLTIDLVPLTSYGGNISGTGGLTKTGAGVLQLSGTNSYSGATTIANGIMEAFFTNSLSANSALTVNAPATLTVFRANTIGSLAGSGALRLDADLTVGGNNTSTVFSGNISSVAPFALLGGLNKAGTGTLVLTGANTYDGGTTVSGGVLRAGGANTLSATSAYTVNSGATLDLNGNSHTLASLAGDGNVTLGAAVLTTGDATSTAFSGSITGSGGLVKTGTGALTLTGNNSYTGGTTINAGTLSGNTAGLRGAITNNAAVTFDQAADGSYAGAMTGTGSLTKTGAGNLILTGASNYSGATSVNSGKLSVNGSIANSAVTVNNGGTLGGNGTLGNTAIGAGGVLAPGNSIGTLTVNGNLSFAPGSIYRVETDAAGNADRVNVNGNLALAGTVDVQAGTGQYAPATTYTILTQTGARTGAFSGVSSNLAFLTPSLVYQNNAVLLNLTRNTVTYDAIAQTANQRSVASYLGGLAGAGGATGVLIGQVNGLSAEQARSAFDNLSGSQHVAGSQVAGAVGRNFAGLMASRTASGAGAGNSAPAGTAGLKAPQFASVNPALLARPGDVVSDSPLAAAAAGSDAPPVFNAQATGGLWGQATGHGGRTASDGNGAASKYRANGFAFGYDQPLTPAWLAGVAMAYGKTQWDANTRGTAAGSGTVESPQAGLYARYADGPLQVRLDASYTDHRFDTSRTVSIGNAVSVARSNHRGAEWGFGAQAEYAFKQGDWRVSPLAALRHSRLSEDGFDETGAAGANLSVASRNSQNTVASLGMKFARAFNSGAGGVELRAIASHLVGDNDAPISSRLAGQAASFSASGTPLKRTALTLGGALTGQLSQALSAYADAAYEYRGSGQNAFMLTAGLRMAW